MIERVDPTNITYSLYYRSKIRIIAPSISTPVFAYFYNLSIPDEMQIDNGDYRNFILSETVV